MDGLTVQQEVVIRLDFYSSAHAGFRHCMQGDGLEKEHVRHKKVHARCMPLLDGLMVQQEVVRRLDFYYSAHAGLRHCMQGDDPEKEHAGYIKEHARCMPLLKTVTWSKGSTGSCYKIRVLNECTCWVLALHARYWSKKRTCRIH